MVQDYFQDYLFGLLKLLPFLFSIVQVKPSLVNRTREKAKTLPKTHQLCPIHTLEVGFFPRMSQSIKLHVEMTRMYFR